MVSIWGSTMGRSRCRVSPSRTEQATSCFREPTSPWPTASQPFHQDYDFTGDLTAGKINIFVDTTGLGGNSDYVGLDNIQFAQVAPEPSTWVHGVSVSTKLTTSSLLSLLFEDVGQSGKLTLCLTKSLPRLSKKVRSIGKLLKGFRQTFTKPSLFSTSSCRCL